MLINYDSCMNTLVFMYVDYRLHIVPAKPDWKALAFRPEGGRVLLSKTR
jgi:hypothetical protein